MERSSGLDNQDQAPQNLWIGNTTLTCFCTSKLVSTYFLGKTTTRKMDDKISGITITESSSDKVSSNPLCDRDSFIIFVDKNS